MANNKKLDSYSCSSQQEKIGQSVVTCIEVALMRRGNANYNLVLAKLQSLYNCDIEDCVNNLEYLRIILKEVYTQDYHSVLEDIALELDTLETLEITDFKSEFYKFMASSL